MSALVFYYGGDILNLDNIQDMTLLELKDVAKKLGLKNISKLKKSELQEEIKKTYS